MNYSLRLKITRRINYSNVCHKNSDSTALLHERVQTGSVHSQNIICWFSPASYMCMLSFKVLKQRYQIRETLSRKHDVNDKGQYLTTAIITKVSINNSLRSISDHKIS